MLSQTGEPFDSDQHLFEIKWDGTRCIAYVEPARIRLVNRRHIEMRERYPEFECLAHLPSGTILDGEIVVLDGGKPSFPKLQQREHLRDAAKIGLRARALPATFIAFDLLYIAGRSLMREPLEIRKTELERVVKKLDDPHVIAPEFVRGAGKRYFAAAERFGLEGIMAKRLASRYQPGKRSADWLKIKVARQDAFEIIGYTPIETGAPAIGALLIGERHGRRWHYKGKVGTGFTDAQREGLFRVLRDAPPLAAPPPEGPRDGVWRQTGCKCMVRYFEKTGVGMLRGPVFKGLVEPGASGE
ncbi:MAG: non-homologous end-joining DNA ligase [Phycisphaerae bacterium]